MRIADKYKHVIETFEQEMPIAESELHFTNPFQLLVAVILSAQCTDKRVNMVTPALFQRYPTAMSMSHATEDDIFEYVKSVSYPRSKSKHIADMATMLVNDFGGIVPDDVEQLQRLPGVGRKTANVVASVAYNKPVIAVDTHVFRVANRIGLTKNSKTPLQTELTLTKYIPKSKLSKAHHWLILHGRYVCVARKPQCEQCYLKQWCDYYNKEGGSIAV
ncbi:MAG: endonuclease III [Bacteroidales bacterium]|nr:endonuclease III [Bacteroidales bacterium]